MISSVYWMISDLCGDFMLIPLFLFCHKLIVYYFMGKISGHL